MNCAVKDCYTNVLDFEHRDGIITFHRFPKACHKVWQKLAGLSSDNWKWKPNQKICSMHFEEHCFVRTGKTVRLRKDAMPTLLLPNNDVQESEHSNPLRQPQSTLLPKSMKISAENIDYSIPNLDATKSTKNSGKMEKSVPVSTNELDSSLTTAITFTPNSELDIKTEPLSMEIEEDELDFASPNLYCDISIKSQLKSHANDIKTEIDVTDYSISNIDTVKTEPTMEMESDRSAMSWDDFPTAVKVEVDSDSSTISADSTTTISGDRSDEKISPEERLNQLRKLIHTFHNYSSSPELYEKRLTEINLKTKVYKRKLKKARSTLHKLIKEVTSLTAVIKGLAAKKSQNTRNGATI